MRYPLSFAQQRPGVLDPASRVCHATWLDGPVDPDVLRRAVDAVVARHPALRTRVGAESEQVVDETARVPVEHVVAPGPDEAGSIARDLAERPFDLGRGPLLRVGLVEAGPGRWVLVLVAHRVVADEATLALVLDDLSTAYRTGTAPPEPWMGYGDFAVWQRERLRGEELARQLAPWREALRDLPEPVRLPAGHPAARVTAVVDPAAVRRLRGVAEGVGATLPEAVLAAYAVVLSRYAGRADVVVEVPVSGRVRVELEPVAGPFADAVPVRVSLAGAPTFGDLLVRARDAAAHAVAHDEVPLTKLAEELGVDPGGARLTFAAQAPPAPDLPDVTVRGHLDLPDATEADLDLRVAEDGGLTLAHRADPGFADWLLRSVVAVLEHADADTAVADLPVPEPAGDWSAAARPMTNGVARPVAAASESEDPAPSRERVEEVMAGIWAELLRTTEPIGVHDSLFVLGGGSLTAVRFAARISDLYGVTLPMDLIFTSPTIAALAAVVADELAPPPDTGLDDLSDAELDDLLHAVMATRERRRTTGGEPR
ncbi:MAG: hypothetical protein HOV94_40040 [Saccharothrix sp.]|nr:hypothetical protein [Saccharothrix sp.]